MTLNPEFQSLCKRWREKAQQYEIEDTHQLFDKFFSLYVAYNALYAETAAYLHRKAISEGKKEYKLDNESFPDKQAAIEYVLGLMKSKNLMQSLEKTESTKQAIEQLKVLMSKQSSLHFWICLDPVFGKPQEDKDEELNKMLNSPSTDERARAILGIIYQVRCNMFHGRKSVSPVQGQLLIPLIVLLEKIIDKLYQKLESAIDY
ncbi:MAG: hypothetical protein DCF17_14585 [Shackletoniella antarctica]|jgi:hypothetical protein|uniref:Apea-like HEPN domain-containing protein n=1 Tax=Shackletoniella antarctica TaxID=268115 RepID=A0A2W4Y5M4_9CYAN|nr:MAG: hypothetical protein DCF17_14585 [Shackletoniella antarctica]